MGTRFVGQIQRYDRVADFRTTSVVAAWLVSRDRVDDFLLVLTPGGVRLSPQRDDNLMVVTYARPFRT